MRVPAVTVECPCGESTKVPLGEALTCGCGRRWDTAGLRADALPALRAVTRRYRRQQLAFVATFLLAVGLLAVIARSAPVAITGVAALLVWLRFARPWWRRRRQAHLRDLPTWQLRERSARRG